MNDENSDLPLPDSEVDTPIDKRHAAILAAMDEIQNRKPGWMRAVILFAVTLSLFVGAGTLSDSLQFLAILIAVLLVHESGHYLAMRWFGYRNVRMFFIPFLGAAVSGQHFNVAGWKKVVVSLLGPVPGIGLGILLGLLAIYLKGNPAAAANVSYKVLLQIATISVVINGFNLLPILPLDGGWVMHALIFCRHPVFDAGFRLAATLMLLFLGASLSWLFLILGVILLLGIPTTYRMAKLARQLKIENVPRDADPTGAIPAITATRIIDGVEAGTRHGASPQIVAMHSLKVFETLNATPPGVVVSVLLMTIHAVSLIVSMMAGFAFSIEKVSSCREFLALYQSAPKYLYLRETTEVWDSKGWVPSEADEKLVLIAHRRDLQLAIDEFAKLSEKPPAAGRLTRFGQTLLVDVKDDAAHDAWKKQLQLGGEVLPRGLISVRVQCTLPSDQQAEFCVQDCRNYVDSFSSPDWLTPPWSHSDNLTAAGLERVRLARRTFQRVREKEDELGAVAEVGETYAREIAPATIVNDQKRINELTEQLRKEQLANLRNAVKEVRGAVSSPVEGQVLDLILKHEMFSPLEYSQPEPPPELADLFGSFVRDAEGRISFEDAGSKCFDLRATHASVLVAIEVESFESTTVGLTRISKWLCRQGAPFIQYDITTKPDPLPNE